MVDWPPPTAVKAAQYNNLLDTILKTPLLGSILFFHSTYMAATVLGPEIRQEPCYQ